MNARNASTTPIDAPYTWKKYARTSAAMIELVTITVDSIAQSHRV